MDSMRGDDSSNEKYPQSLDHSNKDIPISDKRMTRTNFEPRPELENVGTAKRARTPDDPQGVAGSVKRLATLTEGRSPSTLVGKAATRGSQRSITKQGLKGLELVKAAKEGRSVTSRPICSGSPWERYIKRYELNLDDHIYIVSDKSTLDTFMIKCLKGLDAEKKVAMLERVQHKSFLPMLECFNFENSYYPVFPHIAMPLSQIIHSPPYPTELELTAVLGQILNGLQYLVSRKLEHGSLSSSNIFIGTDGNIIIAGHECCREVASDQRGRRDMAALEKITMLLMQKVANKSGFGGAYDVDRWPPNCKAFEFLAEIQVAKTLDQLMQHPLLRLRCKEKQIKWMVDLATNTSATSYTYHEQGEDLSRAASVSSSSE